MEGGPVEHERFLARRLAHSRTKPATPFSVAYIGMCITVTLLPIQVIHDNEAGITRCSCRSDGCLLQCRGGRARSVTVNSMEK